MDDLYDTLDSNFELAENSDHYVDNKGKVFWVGAGVGRGGGGAATTGPTAGQLLEFGNVVENKDMLMDHGEYLHLYDTDMKLELLEK